VDRKVYRKETLFPDGEQCYVLNRLPEDPAVLDQYLSMLEPHIEVAKCVFVFSSSGWTRTDVLPKERFEKTIKFIQDKFLES